MNEILQKQKKDFEEAVQVVELYFKEHRGLAEDIRIVFDDNEIVLRFLSDLEEILVRHEASLKHWVEVIGYADGYTN